MENGRYEMNEAVRDNCLSSPVYYSLRRRRINLTSVSNVCEAGLRSLFWFPNGFNGLPEMQLIGK